MKPILGYFKLRGWAGPIRLLLAYLEVDYVEKFYQLPLPEPTDGKNYQKTSTCDECDWKLEKDALCLQFPNLPYWIDNNVKLTETKAILRHVARTRNPALLGQTLEAKANLNMWEEVLWDMWNSLCQICLKNDDEVNRQFLALTKSKLELLSRNFTGVWCMGSKITLADFLLYEILHHYNTFTNGTILHSFPTLKMFMITFERIPQISRYINSEQFINGPCFSYKFKSRL